MTLSFSKIRPVLVLALALSGCSSDAEKASAPEPPVLDATISGAIVDEDVHAVPGMEVCVYERPEIPCVMSNSIGRYELPVPSHQRLIIRYAKDDFIPKLRPLDTGESGSYSFWIMQRRAWDEEQLASAGLTLQADSALVSLQVSGATEGATFALDPSAGSGPVYCGQGLKVDMALKATGAAGIGVFANVPAGKYRATFSHPSASCVTRASDDPDPGSVELVTVPGHLTAVSADCE